LKTRFENIGRAFAVLHDDLTSIGGDAPMPGKVATEFAKGRHHVGRMLMTPNARQVRFQSR
jgi:hypothetical protein